MHLLSHIRDLFTDFLFPKSFKVRKLEALSTDALTQILPKAQHLKEKNTMALFDYNHFLVKEIIWELKYSGNVRIAGKLGEILYDYILHELVDLNLFESSSWQREKLILIPIPISDKRRLERGWNQSELLAIQIMMKDSKKMFKYLPGQLLKRHDTLSQIKTRSRKERLQNLTDSMIVKDEQKVGGACVIVIDDVTTTGSTFKEARRALFSAGAKRILCIAVAH